MTAPPPILYRRDVDGLRAIAVLAVVVYHAAEGLLPGGFIGVDIFFVISGYLITGLIAREMAAGTFSILRFYVRRAKRILPALFVVLAATLALGSLILAPTDLVSLGRTTTAAAAFASNIEFWRSTGYFDTVAERKPLLHTWSLAVEEQFYLLWPLVLALTLRLRLAPRRVLFILIGGSFALAVFAAIEHPPSGFFLLPARSWELLVGAALALGLVPVPSGRRARDITGLLGLGLIVFGAVWLDRYSPFPGWNALLPCAGALLLIAAGVQGRHITAEWLLEQRPMVFIGLISYSLYLWHWPLLAIARIVNRGHLSVAAGLALAGASIVLATVTWRYVERFFRAGADTPLPGPILWRYAAGTLTIATAGLLVSSTGGFIEFASPRLRRIEAARFDVNPDSGPCLRWQSQVGPLAEGPCLDGDPNAPRLVVWGDSHADSIEPAFQAVAGSRGLTVHQLTMASCPPLLDATLHSTGSDYAPCEMFNQQVLQYIQSDPRVTTVALSARWALYAEASRFGHDDAGQVVYLLKDDDEVPSLERSRQVLREALQTTVDRLRAAQKHVVIVGSIPAMGFNVPECLARNHLPLSAEDDCVIDAASVAERIRFADESIAALTETRPGLCVVFPSQELCHEGVCRPYDGEDILYANDDHISLRGALFLSERLGIEDCLQLPQGRRHGD